MDPRELLGMIAFFSETLNGDEIFMLASRARRLTFPAGGVVLREDDPATSLFVIESGTVRITVEGESDPLSELHAGDFFGEMSLLIGQPRNATVTAVEPTAIYEIDRAALAPVLAEAPALAERFADTMLRRQEQLDHLYGNPAWGMERVGRAELLADIKRFYSNN
jgi:CRP-like cAMP-binding protein